MTKQLCVLFLLLLAGLFPASEATAQSANLSFQGILKKANGLAVDDGNYDLTFRLYDVETGGSAANIKHEETINDVEIAGGIYSVILGAQAGSPLTAAFDVPYFLGIKVGGPSATEMSPRIRLTSAPYALALRGSSNVFPGSGTVQADKIEVNGGVLAEGGAPGLNGANNNGYAFKDNNGDNDSGLFSTAEGTVALYANNSERILVSNTVGDNRTYLRGNVTVDNSLTISDQLIVTNQITANGNLNFASNDGLQYNGVSDWKLIHREDFTGGLNGWNAYTAFNGGTATTNPTVTTLSGGFSSNTFIQPASNNHILKKQFDLGGIAHTFIMVKFNYYFIDSWDGGDEDQGIAGFSSGLAGDAEFGWSMAVDNTNASGAHDFTNNTGRSDHSGIYSMLAKNSSNNPVILFGATLNDGTSDETYGVSNIEIWVR